MKISIIGTGHVGTTLAYTLLHETSIDELVLVNRTFARAAGEAADLEHALAFMDSTMQVIAGHARDTVGSGIIVLTLSVPASQPDRTKLASGNAKLFRDTIPQLARLSPDAVLVVVSNPVEALTQLALELSGFEPHRVLGTGTLIDSARLRSELSKHLQIHADDVRAYVIGEHGDTQFPVLSNVSTGGIRLQSMDVPAGAVERAVRSSHEVFLRKGHTNFAIAQATAMIIRSIVGNQLRTLPVSTRIERYAGVEDICLSIPCVIGRAGVVRQLFPSLDDSEIQQLQQCARTVRAALQQMR